MLPILAKHFHVTVDYLLNIGGNTMKTIESKHFIIREWSESDAIDLFELKEKNKQFISYLNFKTVNDSLDIIKIWKEYRELYPLVSKETSTIIGVVGVVDIGRYKGYSELEVHICDEYNNVELSTEAHSLILDYAFNELGILVACAYSACEDDVLKNAMQNTGFVFEGTLRKFGRNMSDTMRYSLLKDEFTPII